MRNPNYLESTKVEIFADLEASFFLECGKSENKTDQFFKIISCVQRKEPDYDDIFNRKVKDDLSHHFAKHVGQELKILQDFLKKALSLENLTIMLTSKASDIFHCLILSKLQKY